MSMRNGVGNGGTLLLLNFWDKKASLNFLIKKLNVFWATNGMIQVLYLSNEFFMARFKNEGDYSLALFEVPGWFLITTFSIELTIIPPFHSEANLPNFVRKLILVIDVIEDIFSLSLLKTPIEKKALELTMFTFKPECWLNLRKRSAMTRAWEHLDLENNKMSSTNSKWEILGPLWEILIDCHIFFINYSLIDSKW